MSIQKIIMNEAQKLKEPSLKLREGQIIQGKILKLYPNNKAQIQLGFHQLIAQLEASLKLGERYYFQVKNTDNVTQLKVIGDTLSKQNQSNVEALVRQLGVKPTKYNVSLVENLLQNKIPFDKPQLQHAITILERADNKAQAISVIRGMFDTKLPMTDTVFRALVSNLTEGFSDNIRQLSQDLQGRQNVPISLTRSLTEQLAQLSGTSRIDSSRFQTLVQDQAVFQVLKASGVIKSETQFTDINTAANREGSQIVKAFHSQLNMSNNEALLKNLSKIETIVQNAQAISLKWGEVIQTSIKNNAVLDTGVFHNLLQDLKQKPIQITQSHEPVENRPQQLERLFQDLNVLTHKGNIEKLDRIVFQLMREIFLNQTNQVLSDVGLNYEKVIAQDENNPTNTLKGMLLQLVQSGEGSGTNQEQVTKLLQFINGLQIQSVNETAKFIEANLVLPGGSLGLENDIEMSFEGQKNGDGEINPNFCRIVFYLDLANIQKTVVDMNVQKRAVSLTILNDFPIDGITHSLKPLLKEGLQKLDYHLSSVTHRPLTNQETKSPERKNTYKTPQVPYEGVDFRI